MTMLVNMVSIWSEKSREIEFRTLSLLSLAPFFTASSLPLKPHILPLAFSIYLYFCPFQHPIKRYLVSIEFSSPLLRWFPVLSFYIRHAPFTLLLTSFSAPYLPLPCHSLPPPPPLFSSCHSLCLSLIHLPIPRTYPWLEVWCFLFSILLSLVLFFPLPRSLRCPIFPLPLPLPSFPSSLSLVLSSPLPSPPPLSLIGSLMFPPHRLLSFAVDRLCPNQCFSWAPPRLPRISLYFSISAIFLSLPYIIIVLSLFVMLILFWFYQRWERGCVLFFDLTRPRLLLSPDHIVSNGRKTLICISCSLSRI